MRGQGLISVIVQEAEERTRVNISDSPGSRGEDKG